MTALVNDALNNNLDLKAAAARVDAAREQTIIAGAGRWPQLGFATGYVHTGSGAGVLNNNLENTDSSGFEALFTLSWEIDVWGRIKASQQAAQQDAEAVSADFQGARLSLAARTAQSYFELIEANLQAQVAEQSIKDRRTIVELVRGRFTRGLTRGLDLRLALTDLANAEAQLAQSRNQVQIVTRQLEVLLGRYPNRSQRRAHRISAGFTQAAGGFICRLAVTIAGTAAGSGCCLFATASDGFPRGKCEESAIAQNYPDCQRRRQ